MFGRFHHLKTMPNLPPFIFFGTPDIAVVSLEMLKEAGFVPACIVTAADTRQGRGMTLTPSPAAQWADTHSIPALKPEKLSDPDLAEKLRAFDAGVFVVVAYGKIIPQTLLDIPEHGTLNMHPSLLPRHRGPSPVEAQILSETDKHNVGVSIMLLDEKMDHGPVLAQESVADELSVWPVGASVLRPLLARHGAALLAATLPRHVTGEIHPVPQNDANATYCKMMKKEDALIDLSGDARANYLKILAYEVWPRAYFFTEKNGKKIRVVVTAARYENDALVLERVIPEGKKEMVYGDFVR